MANSSSAESEGDQQQDNAKSRRDPVVKAAIITGVAAIIAAAITLLAHSSGDQIPPQVVKPQPGTTSVPTTTPPAPQSVLAQVRIDTPSEGTPIRAGQDVQFSGSVTGLGADTLWIISKPDTGAGLYFLPTRGPVADHDGNWQFLDQESGDPSNHNIVFKAVQADSRCSEELAVSGPTWMGPIHSRRYQKHAK